MLGGLLKYTSVKKPDILNGMAPWKTNRKKRGNRMKVEGINQIVSGRNYVSVRPNTT